MCGLGGGGRSDLFPAYAAGGWSHLIKNFVALIDDSGYNLLMYFQQVLPQLAPLPLFESGQLYAGYLVLQSIPDLRRNQFPVQE